MRAARATEATAEGLRAGCSVAVALESCGGLSSVLARLGAGTRIAGATLGNTAGFGVWPARPQESAGTTRNARAIQIAAIRIEVRRSNHVSLSMHTLCFK
jgi:hypothetical protein